MHLKLLDYNNYFKTYLDVPLIHLAEMVKLVICNLSYMTLLISSSATMILFVAQDLKLEPARIFEGARYIAKKAPVSSQPSESSEAIKRTCDALLPIAHPGLIAATSESFLIELGISDK